MHPFIGGIIHSLRFIAHLPHSFYPPCPCSGFTYGALVTRTPQGPFLVGLVGAAVAGLTDLSERLDPTEDEAIPRQDPRAAVAPPPRDLAHSAATMSASNGRMLR